jgi:hypothetical protein
VIVSPSTTRQAEPDQVCAEAVDLARAAAEDDAGPGEVGVHVGMEVEGDRVVTHLFACLSPGYVGWRWAVTVARAARAKMATVSESVLLPGPDSLLAPDWVPWTERVRPGDLKAGDLMPAGSDDDRLVPVVAIAAEAGLLDWDEGDAWRLGVGAAAEAAQPPTAEAAQPPPAEAAQPPAEAAQPPSEAAQPPTAESASPPAAAGAGAQPAAAEAGPQPLAAAGPPAGPTPPAGQPETGGLADRSAPAQPAARADTGTRARGKRRSGPSRARAQSVGVLRPARVLSAAGRDEAAGRWYAGDQGPSSALASAAPATCLTCGFMVRLSGPLGRVFGVCANEYAPDDGRVVSVDHGCGAHSEGATGIGSPVGDTVTPKVDELGYDMLTAGATLPESVLETIDHELL